MEKPLWKQIGFALIAAWLAAVSGQVMADFAVLGSTVSALIWK